MKSHELLSDLYKYNIIKSGTYSHALLVCKHMLRLAKEHHRLQEHYCNGDLTKRQLTREANIEASLIEIAKDFGIRVTFSGDPRGYTVHLHASHPSFYNTWGGKEAGYGI